MDVADTDAIVTALARDRSELMAASAPERVARLLRTRITEGLFPPGGHLSEEMLGQALGVSRNTLREAFRLLCHERLAVHEMHRGFSVRVLSAEDVVDLYRLRRLVEGAAARHCATAAPAARQAVLDAVEVAEHAAEAGNWLEVRTGDLRFHQDVARLAGSRRVDELMRQALAELRLAFHAMPDPESFHAPYIHRNRRIAELVVAGHGEEAERELVEYLLEAEREILAAFDPARDASSRALGTGTAVRERR